MRLQLLFAIPLILIFFLAGSGCRNSSGAYVSSSDTTGGKISPGYLDSLRGKIVLLYDSIGEPLPGDWLAANKEPYVSFEFYRRSSPVRPDDKRNKIYIQPFNDLDSNGRRIVELVAEYMRAFYGLEVKVSAPADIFSVPQGYRRGAGEYEQFKTGYLLDAVLGPALPEDAAVMIGLTSKDLYPEDTWNFVFGQAYLRKRVGVWSIARLCGPETKSNAWKNCIPRTLHTASHETGHMFSLGHCTVFKCSMNGSNSLDESDRQPPWLCPDCLCKLNWNLQRDPLDHLVQLRDFWKKHNIESYAAFYDSTLLRLK